MITVYSLRAGDEATIALQGESSGCFGDSISGSRSVGVFVGGGSVGSVLPINRFVINRKILSFSVIENASEIRVRLYVHDCESRIGGELFLPPTAQMAIESSIDRVVGAAGSFGLNLR
jgi:hypothetical protein